MKDIMYEKMLEYTVELLALADRVAVSTGVATKDDVSQTLNNSLLCAGLVAELGSDVLDKLYGITFVPSQELLLEWKNMGDSERLHYTLTAHALCYRFLRAAVMPYLNMTDSETLPRAIHLQFLSFTHEPAEFYENVESLRDVLTSYSVLTLAEYFQTAKFQAYGAKFTKFVLDEAQETSCGVMEVKTIARGNSTVN